MSTCRLRQNRRVRIRMDILVRNLGRDLGLDAATIRYVLKRLRAEGVTFLTKTLPLISKALLYSLEVGYFAIKPDPAVNYAGLTQFRHKGRSLCIMQSLLSRIFDREGLLLWDADPQAIRSIRQFCDYFYKLSFEFDEKDLAAAEKQFVEVESECSTFVDDPEWVYLLRKNAMKLYPSFYGAYPHEIFAYKGPRDGPGTFAGAPKSVWHIFKKLPSTAIGLCADVFRPFSGFFKAYPSSKEKVCFARTRKVAEVLFVPKDSRGPRVISRENLHLLKAQMAFFDWASSTLQRDTDGRVQFNDQEINKNLALEGSKTKTTATLDLKEASERVRISLVRKVFSDAPGVRYFLRNARSTELTLPSGLEIHTSKVGGMGSGLTFPLLGLMTHLSIVTSISHATRISVQEVSRQVYVYGDDVVVPSQWYHTAVKGLQNSGLKVNTLKSYSDGLFRESCGGDYYNGVDVTPVRLRLSSAGLKKPVSYSPNGGIRPLVLEDHGILQLERHCRELVSSNLINTSEYLYSEIEKVIPLPFVAGDSPVLGRYTNSWITPIDQMGVVPVPVVDTTEYLCPFKYIGGVFKSPPSVEGHTYGEVARPRQIRLIQRVVTPHERAGIPCAYEGVELLPSARQFTL